MNEAAISTIIQYPQLIDYFIKYKEEDGDRAVSISSEKVKTSKELYVEQFQRLPNFLEENTNFYKIPGNTYDEAYQRAMFLKDAVENKGVHRIFYVDGQPIRKEEDVQILYRLTWYATSHNVSREVNDGRGPVDFMVSNGSQDKTLVEFKLAKNSKLKSNLEKQTKIYEKASDADRSIKVIFYFTYHEKLRVMKILRQLKMDNDPDVVLVDARNDNKPSGSKA